MVPSCYHTYYTHTYYSKAIHQQWPKLALDKLGRAARVTLGRSRTLVMPLQRRRRQTRQIMFVQLTRRYPRRCSRRATHFLIPVIQRPIVIDVRTKPLAIPSVTGTKRLASGEY
jgi:prohibitin 1